jgi:hypothetical protein
MSSYNITIKCDSEEDRDLILNTLETLVDKGVVRFRKDALGNPNVFFSEEDLELEWNHWRNPYRTVT